MFSAEFNARLENAGPFYPCYLGPASRMELVPGSASRHSRPSMKEKRAKISRPGVHGYNAVLADVVHLIETARSTAARTVNAVMTATYWAIGQRIVEHEQGCPCAPRSLSW